MRRAVRIRRAIGLFLVLLGLILAFWLTTPWGLRWTFYWAQEFVPGQLSVGRLDGSLMGPMEVAGLVYENGDRRVSVQRLRMDWRPGRLVAARVHVTSMEAEGIVVEMPPAEVDQQSTSAPTFTGFSSPLTVRVDNASILRVRIRNAGQPAVSVNSVNFSASLERERLQLGRFDVDSPDGHISVSGTVGLQPEAGVDVQTRWRLQAAGLRPVTGAGTLSGTLKQLVIEQQISTPVQAALTGRIQVFNPGLPWSAMLALEKTGLQSLRPDWPALAVGGRIQGSGTLEAFSADGSLELDDPGLGPWRADLKLQRRVDGWNVPALTLEHREQAARLSARGRWNGGIVDGRGQAALDWQDLQWPIEGNPRVSSSNGSLQVVGTPGDYGFEWNAVLDSPRIPQARISAKGSGSTEQITFAELSGHWLEGDWQGRGQVHWKPALQWSAQMTASGVRPESGWPEWPGRIDASLQTDGGLDDGKLTVEGRLQQLAGELRGYPVSAQGRFAVKPDAMVADALQVRSGSATLTANAHLGDQWSADWVLEAPRLEEVLPAGVGSVTSRGTLSGPPASLRVQAGIQGRGLEYRDYRVADLDGELNVTLANDQPGTVSVTARSVRLGQLEFDDVQLKGAGSADTHTLSLIARMAGSGQGRLRLAGGYQARGWAGQIEQLQVQLPQPAGGAWNLRSESRLSLSRQQVQLAHVCLEQSQAALCAAGEWKARGSSGARVQLEQLPVEYLTERLQTPQPFSVQGSIDGAGEVRMRDGQLERAQLDLNSDGGTLRYGFEEHTRESAYRAARISASLDETGLSAGLSLELVDAARMDGRLQLPGWKPQAGLDSKQPLDGSIDVVVHDFSLVPVFVPDVQEVAGKLEADLTVAGSAGAPQFTGTGRVQGQAQVPRLGLELNDIDLNLRGTPQEGLALVGRIHSGPGLVEANARLTFQELAQWQARLSLKGNRFQVARLPQAQVLATPDLNFDITPGQITIDGSVHIPEATIELPEPGQAVSASPDVVVTGGPDTADRQPRWKVRARVALSLGDAVKVSGYGFEGRVGGNLTLVETEQAPTTAQGSLFVAEGKYEAYGQELDISQGRLLYAGGPVTNPGLDLRAVRKIQEVTAGLSVGGTLKSPTLDLFSTPAMDDGNVLSYLLLGRPMQQASGDEGEMLARAAASLGLSGGELLAARIGQQFGIDEVYIDKGATAEDASLVLGTYLSPKLYVRYTTSLLKQEAVIRLRYQLSSKWSVETQGGAETGADLLYTIER